MQYHSKFLPSESANEKSPVSVTAVFIFTSILPLVWCEYHKLQLTRKVYYSDPSPHFYSHEGLLECLWASKQQFV